MRRTVAERDSGGKVELAGGRHRSAVQIRQHDVNAEDIHRQHGIDDLELVFARFGAVHEVGKSFVGRDEVLAAVVGEAVDAVPGLSCIPADATYLAWIDCRGTGVDDPQAACEAAGLGPSDGREFAAPGFIRINTACPTARLEEALRRLRRAFTPA